LESLFQALVKLTSRVHFHEDVGVVVRPPEPARLSPGTIQLRISTGTMSAGRALISHKGRDYGSRACQMKLIRPSYQQESRTITKGEEIPVRHAYL
jgi:hypothetical protein